MSDGRLVRAASRCATLDGHPFAIGVVCLAMVTVLAATCGGLPEIGHPTLAWRLARLAAAAMALWMALRALTGLCSLWQRGREVVGRWGADHGHHGLAASWDRAWGALLRAGLAALDRGTAVILLVAAACLGLGCGLLFASWRLLP